MLTQKIQIICDVMLCDMLCLLRRFGEKQVLHFRASYFTLLGTTFSLKTEALHLLVTSVNLCQSTL